MASTSEDPNSYPEVDHMEKLQPYMMPAKDLEIEFGDDKEMWEWIFVPLPNTSSRVKVAKLKQCYWLEIIARTNLALHPLSPNANYVVYFVFKLDEGSQGLGRPFHEAVISRKPDKRETTRVILHESIVCLEGIGEEGVVKARERSDGWMEVSLGVLSNYGGEEKVKLRAMDCKRNRVWEKKGEKGKEPPLSKKCGLVVRGLEFKPYV